MRRCAHPRRAAAWRPAASSIQRRLGTLDSEDNLPHHRDLRDECGDQLGGADGDRLAAGQLSLDWLFAAAGAALTSDSTLRFGGRDGVDADLHGNSSYTVIDVRDVPDR